MPQWQGELTGALKRARERLSHARVDGVEWYWPAEEEPARGEPQEMVRLLAPFDPVVRDRARFELLWGWLYRFEAYTPAPKRKLGYYALPLLWRDRVIGWGNLSVKNGELESEFGYVESHPPRDRAFERELDAELDRMRAFLGLDPERCLKRRVPSQCGELLPARDAVANGLTPFSKGRLLLVIGHVGVRPSTSGWEPAVDSKVNDLSAGSGIASVADRAQGAQQRTPLGSDRSTWVMNIS